jgi:hypothetical protein
MNELQYSHSTIDCTCHHSPAFMPLKFYLVFKSERQDDIVVLKNMTLCKNKGQDDIFMLKDNLCWCMSLLLGWQLCHTSTSIEMWIIWIQNGNRNVTHHIRCIVFPSQTDFEHSYIHLLKHRKWVGSIKASHMQLWKLRSTPHAHLTNNNDASN